MAVIKYSIVKKDLSKSKGEMFVGKLHMLPPATMSVLVDIMANKNTTISRQDILGVMSLFHEVVREQLADGRIVSTPIFRAGLSLRGEFTSKEDQIDYKRHKPRITIQPAKGLTKRVTFGMRFHREKGSDGNFYIHSIYALATIREVDSFARGAAIEIQGRGFKEYKIQAGYAVEYYRGGGVKKIAESPLLKHTYSRIVTIIPDTLEPGEYSISIMKKLKKETRRTAGLVVMIE